MPVHSRYEKGRNDDYIVWGRLVLPEGAQIVRVDTFVRNSGQSMPGGDGYAPCYPADDTRDCWVNWSDVPYPVRYNTTGQSRPTVEVGFVNWKHDNVRYGGFRVFYRP